MIHVTENRSATHGACCFDGTVGGAVVGSTGLIQADNCVLCARRIGRPDAEGTGYHLRSAGDREIIHVPQGPRGGVYTRLAFTVSDDA